MQRVALLGVGTMGAGMAANWLKKGFPLSVWNRTPVRAEPLVAEGAMLAATPRAAAEGADVIVAMVVDDDASRDVWLGPAGALESAKPGAIVIESSTLTSDWVRELAGKAQEQTFSQSAASRLMPAHPPRRAEPGGAPAPPRLTA